MNLRDKAQTLLRTGESSVLGMARDLHFDVIGFVVRKLQETGISKGELAAKIGVKESQISRILNAEGNLTQKTIAKLYWAFGSKPMIMERPDEGKTAKRASSPVPPPTRSAVRRRRPPRRG